MTRPHVTPPAAPTASPSSTSSQLRSQGALHSSPRATKMSSSLKHATPRRPLPAPPLPQPPPQPSTTTPSLPFGLFVPVALSPPPLLLLLLLFLLISQPPSSPPSAAVAPSFPVVLPLLAKRWAGSGAGFTQSLGSSSLSVSLHPCFFAHSRTLRLKCPDPVK